MILKKKYYNWGTLHSFKLQQELNKFWPSVRRWHVPHEPEFVLTCWIRTDQLT